MTTFLKSALLLFTAVILPACAQTWDASGNALLKGTYYFREVVWAFAQSDELVLYGTLNFDGNGSYTMSATGNDYQGGPFQQAFTGTYVIASSGHGFLSNPILSSATSTQFVYGVVSQQGIFVGSSTESGLNDLFIAAPVSSPAATSATFKGSYWLAEIDPSSGDPLSSTNALFQLNPDGVNSLGSVTGTGYLGQTGSTVYTQTNARLNYAFSNGAGVLSFPSASQTALTLLTGQKYLYISPDGNFIFGGSPQGWDMFVGVRTASGGPDLSPLYVQAGLDADAANENFDTFYGSFAASGGSTVGHKRFVAFASSALDFTYGEAYSVKPDGTYSTAAMRYVVGAGGIRIGSGIGPSLGLNIALPALAPTSSGVFLNPLYIENVASYSPFTAGVAPGEFIVLAGSGLASAAQTAPPGAFPTALGGVQVTVNGTAAPLYYVSPTAIYAIVPYELTSSVASIQVVADGGMSNVVSMFVNITSPGIFTQNSNGLGYAAMQHADYSLVTPASPAQAGETVMVYLTGLGAVSPAVDDGSLAPTDPLSQASNTAAVYIGGVPATVSYAGLAPGTAGLYQINVQIPAGLTAGDNPLDISGSDAYTSQALIPIGSGSPAAAVSAMPRVRPLSTHFIAGPSRCLLGRPVGCSVAKPRIQ